MICWTVKTLTKAQSVHRADISNVVHILSGYLQKHYSRFYEVNCKFGSIKYNAVNNK